MCTTMTIQRHYLMRKCRRVFLRSILFLTDINRVVCETFKNKTLSLILLINNKNIYFWETFILKIDSNNILVHILFSCIFKIYSKIFKYNSSTTIYQFFIMFSKYFGYLFSEARHTAYN